MFGKRSAALISERETAVSTARQNTRELFSDCDVSNPYHCMSSTST